LRKKLRLEELTPRHLLVAGAALFVLSLLVTLVVLLAAGRKDSAPVAAQQASPRAETRPARLRARDFILDEPKEEPQPDIFFFRPRFSRWSEEQVRRFWVPLDEVLLEHLRRENDSRIEKLFEGVP
jgi:hypothetical protein